MDKGCFYFLTDQYYLDFPDRNLMQNKEREQGLTRDRPCFYAFPDEKTGLYWMIPVSSQTEKFRPIHQRKMQRYGRCDTILFGQVLGHEKVFLIQNMCPVDPGYIKNQYMDSVSSLPVRVDGVLEKKLIQSAKKTLALQRKGADLIFPDVLSIEEKLLKK